MLRPTFSASLLLLLSTAHASADVDRCAGADIDLAWNGTDVAEIAGDTGWFPSGSVAQMRLTGRVVGETAVDAGMRTTACWDERMQASLAGRQGTGYLDVAYGAEIKLRARIHTSVLGNPINWEGDIPIPYLPSDLLLSGQAAFNPTIDSSSVVRVSDSTAAITLLSTDLIGNLIGITGISGGLRVSVTPMMSTSYRTRSATINGASVASSNTKVNIAAQHGFGAALELPITAEGLIRYEPSLRFHATFDIKILGVRVVDWQLFSIPMNLPAIERPMRLTGSAARVPLPQLDGLGESARMDFASGSTQQLRVGNLGEGPLSIELENPPAGVAVARVDVADGSESMLRVVVASDEAFAGGPISLTLATNDPERPTVTLVLGKEVGGTDPGEPSEDAEAPSEGGCSTGSPSGLGICFLFLLVLVRRRR